VSTVVYGDFEWDEHKAEANLKAHGIRFEEAAEALATDPLEISVEDPTDASRVVSLVMSTGSASSTSYRRSRALARD